MWVLVLLYVASYKSTMVVVPFKYNTYDECTIAKKTIESQRQFLSGYCIQVSP